MLEFLMEVATVILGATAGIWAIASAIVTYRAIRYGRPAYYLNRKNTYPSMYKTAAGIMKAPSSEKEPRTSHGLAINVKTMEIVIQQRLSPDAVDDVLGTRTAW